MAQQQLMVDGPLPSGVPASIAAAFRSSQPPARSQGVYASANGLAGVQVGPGHGSLGKQLPHGVAFLQPLQCATHTLLASRQNSRPTY